MDLHSLKAPEFENYIFSVWSVYMCVCVISKTQKKTSSRNIKFSILTFYKDWTKTARTGAYKRILILNGLLTEFFLSEFSYI